LFHIVPKRAFESAEQLDAFRNMLRNLIGSRTGGFPVGAGSTASGSQSDATESEGTMRG
jgi:hypothetical protein